MKIAIQRHTRWLTFEEVGLNQVDSVWFSFCGLYIGVEWTFQAEPLQVDEEGVAVAGPVT